MRWDGQRLSAVGAQPAGASEVLDLPGLGGAIRGLLRTVTTPEFAEMRFHEVVARSALNRVPGSSPMPFRWTINPYRGCSHACVYCFARGTHTYLELDTGEGFNRDVVVKVSWAGPPGRVSTSRWAPTPIRTSGPRAGTG
jgi:hypothetical protein